MKPSSYFLCGMFSRLGLGQRSRSHSVCEGTHKAQSQLKPAKANSGDKRKWPEKTAKEKKATAQRETILW